jgi:hypothetical protein
MVLHKFDIFTNKQSETGTIFLPTMRNLPSNDELTRFDGTI